MVKYKPPITLNLAAECYIQCVRLSVIYQQVLDVAYKLAEDSTDVPKPVDIAEDYTSKCDCNLCIELVS